MFRRISPEVANGLKDLHRYPVLGRSDYQREGLTATLANNVCQETLLDRSTSGSTGERLAIRRTWLEERLLNCFRWRAFRSYGIGPQDRIVNALFRADADPRDDQRLARLAMALGWRQMLVVDALGDEAAAEKALHFAPQCLTGMTSALALLVDQISRQGPDFRPQLVVTTGELLTAPLRNRIASLGSPIRDVYGSNEFNLLAWECPAGAGTYHVCDDSVVLEVLDPDGRPVDVGQTGEVVVTGLHSFAMPFIRYRIGDLAVKGPSRCPCGSPFSTLLEIHGRTIDIFHLAGGIKLHPWTIHNAVRPWLGMVRQASLVQTAPDRLEYLVVATREMGQAEERLISTAAQAALPVGIIFTLRRVESIPPGPGGKARPFVTMAQSANL
jgi:phenylacetate-CoA ligase